MPTTTPAPHELAADLSRRVIGQVDAVKEMSIALAKKLAGLSVGNILLIGSSGTGKTTLMRAVETFLASRPDLALRSTVVRMHANVLGEEAERGRPGEAVLSRLLERAREQLGPMTPVEQLIEQARRGIVFVDEVDKIRSHIGDRVNTSGIRAQEALLTVIENEAVPFHLPAWAGNELVTVDSSGLLFVCAGAFEGLYDAVFDRVTVGRDRGSLKPVTVVEGGQVIERLEFSLRDWLHNEDLFDYGMSPQFLSRFDAVVLLEDLDVDQLVRIFLETPESGYSQARAYFQSRGLDLALSPAAVRRIALEASRQPRLGARAQGGFPPRDPRLRVRPRRAATGVGGAVLLDIPEVEAALKRAGGPKR
ncbi:MAG: AAA domain-containing protein [Thermoanaerobaculia bacterium]|nr:AAA domain-containing protein [Thermoanaerobaculia bacterium]